MIPLCQLATKFPDGDTLVALKGIDVYAACAIIAEFGDLSRFSDAKKLASYTGLTPRQHQSGETKRHGRIARAGPRLLRHVLGEVAHTLVRYPGRYRNKYVRLSKRTGRKKALVATARLLITHVWHLLTRGTSFHGEDTAFGEAKKWRYTMVGRFADRGQVDQAVRLLNIADLHRASGNWEAGRSRLVPP